MSETEAPKPKTRARAEKRREPEVARLEANFDHFWEKGAGLDDFRVRIEAHQVDAVPVNRLGPPNFWGGKGDFVEMIVSAYRQVTEAAVEETMAGG